ncbi:profilin [Pseudomonas sp. Pseusp11]|uniref:profilin n=1 Tax=Pseudomonas sp. Pseusp11 TaxID=3243003 RepID=UPI0039B691A4
MPWQPYVESLTSSGSVAQAAIGGLDGKIWINSPGFNISGDEISAILAGFKDPNILQKSGIIVNGVKYLYLQSDDSQMQGKKDVTGISVAKSSRSVVIGTYISNMQPGNARAQVERIRDHLSSIGY